MNVDVASVVARALSFITTFQGAGAALCGMLLRRHIDRSSQPIWQLARYTAMAGVFFVLLHYLLEAGRMAGDFTGVFDIELQRIAFSSPLSVATGLRICGLVILVVAWRKLGDAASWMSVAAILAIAASFTLIGHTTEEGVPQWSRFALAVHVLVALFWFGSLFPLFVITRLERPERAASAVAAFTRTATVVVPLLFVAGALMILAILGDWHLFRSTYGRLLLAKIGGFVLLMLLASLNKWRYGLRIASEPAAMRSLQTSMITELAIVVAVLITTAVMTSLYAPSES